MTVFPNTTEGRIKVRLHHAGMYWREIASEAKCSLKTVTEAFDLCKKGKKKRRVRGIIITFLRGLKPPPANLDEMINYFIEKG